MSDPKMYGGYQLQIAHIDSHVKNKSPGVYMLGDLNSQGRIDIKYVGRSDDDVKRRLKDHVNKSTHFFYAYCASPKAAFEAECELYHDYSPTKNTIHPDRPKDAKWKCPRCRVFD